MSGQLAASGGAVGARVLLSHDDGVDQADDGALIFFGELADLLKLLPKAFVLGSSMISGAFLGGLRPSSSSAETWMAATTPYEVPSPEDWKKIEERFGMSFPQEYVDFVELLCDFDFPGDFYNVVRSARSNGNDEIATVYDIERRETDFPEWLIPFYGIGNGDYFALDARAGRESSVYYWYHERRRAERYAGSFSEWLSGLENFLAD